MKVYKRVSRWWDPTHGGEFRGHVDFTVEAGECFADAVREAFLASEDSFWSQKLDPGKVWKVHLELAVFEDEEGP